MQTLKAVKANATPQSVESKLGYEAMKVIFVVQNLHVINTIGKHPTQFKLPAGDFLLSPLPIHIVTYDVGAGHPHHVPASALQRLVLLLIRTQLITLS